MSVVGSFTPFRRCFGLFMVLCAAFPLNAAAQSPRPAFQASSAPQIRPATPSHLAPRAAQAQRFLAHRGLRPGAHAAPMRPSQIKARTQYSAGTAVWQPLGPNSVTTSYYGSVSGRVTSLALDPSDPTGNTLYVGTTGGGIWFSSNAGSDPSYTLFSPLTDSVGALNGALASSISIGAVTVQPTNSSVLLAGTGDPNDALDSYYGAGILRSADGGNTWSLIQSSVDAEQKTGIYNFGFYGLGFAGFAWSDKSPQTVVAAVSESYESLLVADGWPDARSAGLYYSIDSGSTWHLATITDLDGQDVQGPKDDIAVPEGNPATAVVWNPARKLFFAAIRYHGYYISPDGITWTQLSTQPGPNFTAANCPTNSTLPGSPACPIFRGALAVNPVTGDTFAWSVDLANQDQGIWQDICSIGTNGQCTNADVTFGVQLTTTPIETAEPNQGPSTIRNGDYTLALAAIPSGQDTMVLAGDDDLWQCTIAPPAGAPLASVYCAWRNTTNSQSCLSAQVGPYQHALAWNPANPLEVFLGTDSGLWRSLDAVGETGSACASTDAAHFQNLNATLGALAEVEHMASPPSTPYTMMLGLGINGTAGVKGSTVAVGQWPQILSGEGGPVAIDPADPDSWYVNNGAGVAIHRCSQAAACTQSDFGLSPAVGNADVANDGLTMSEAAPFLVDPVDHTQLLVGTCRIWRGPDTGGWGAANAGTAMLGSGSSTSYCSGNPLIRTMAAAALPDGGEVVYVGLYGSLDGGANMPGHVLEATVDGSGNWSAWSDLTFNPVANDPQGMNPYGLGISSIVLDPADTTGNTVYVTIQGLPTQEQSIRTLYRSTDGGQTWYSLNSNLPAAPVNALAIDPLDPNTVYVATDTGVYATRAISSCANDGSACWAPMGSGLPISPVTALSATPVGGSPSTLVAGTYGRGVWQVPLFTSGELSATATLSPATLTFPDQPENSASSPLTLTVTNTGGVGLSLTSVTLSGADAADFTESDNCGGQEIVARGTCTIQVLFAPTATGARSAQMSVSGNLTGGNLTAALTGNGTAASSVTLSPAAVSFGSIAVNSQSDLLPVTIENSTASAVSVTSLTATPPFQIASKSCTDSLAASSDCSVSVVFAPTAPGPVSGTLTLVDSEGTHVAQLTGTGTSLPTDTLSPASLVFPDTVTGQPSGAQAITLTNSGQNPLTKIAFATTGPFTQTSNCTTQLAAQSTCAVNVVFLPTEAGAATGTLTLIDILSATPKTIPLSGEGISPPQITPNVASLDFGNIKTGGHSAPKIIAVTNTGQAPMANVGFNLSGNAAASFSVGSALCKALLSPGQTCTGSVIFSPTSSAGATASLGISSSTHGVAPASVVLLGDGGAPGSGLQVKPGSVTFSPPSTSVGVVSAPVTLTLTNINPYQALENLQFASTDEFPVSTVKDATSNPNPCGSTLAAGAACTVAVSFAPSTYGARTGTLTITSDTLIAPTQIVLTGTGFDFTLSLSGPGSASDPVTVASGQTAVFTLKLGPLGADGQFAFQCNLPAQAQYAACPPMAAANLPIGSTGTQSIDVTTSESTAALAPDSLPNLSRSVLLVCGLLALPFALRRRRLLLLLIAALAVSVGAITSCAGASGGKSTPPKNLNTSTTPAGTYTIPVWVTANGAAAVPAGTACDANAKQNGAQRCVNLTMIVD